MKFKCLTHAICLTGIALSLLSCKKTQQNKFEISQGKALVLEAIHAHGGIEKWRNNGALHFRWKYDMADKGVVVDTIQTVDPNTFEAVHTVPNTSTIFGRNADGLYWVSPPDASFVPPIPFWTLTPVYFIGIPFVFDDEQVNFKLLDEKKTFQGKDYIQVQLTYNSGAGESPDDLYVLLIDEDTKLVKGAYYTVTNPLVYDGGTLSKKFITLDNLKEVDGILLASSHTTYSMTDGIIGDQMRSTEVSDVRFIDREHVDFSIPEGAKVFE